MWAYGSCEDATKARYSATFLSVGSQMPLQTNLATRVGHGRVEDGRSRCRRNNARRKTPASPAPDWPSALHLW